MPLSMLQCISPGFVRTEVLSRTYEDCGKDFFDKYPVSNGYGVYVMAQ